jgi:DNA polymerase elongation subunit (family B)
MSDEPRILFLDIETTPNVAYTFDLWRTTIAPVKLIERSRVLCFAAKWYHEPGKTLWYRSYPESRDAMLDAAWTLLDEADVVVHYNGKAFDTPYLNREFLLEEYLPPSPYKEIDLLLTIRKVFQFPSNQLANVAVELGLPGKLEHEGIALWIKCMANDPDAWKVMEKYNKRDVDMMIPLYEELKPWILSHPSHAAFTGKFVCPACGSKNLEKRGFAYTSVSKYQRLHCLECGKYSRDTKRLSGASITGITQ